MGISIIAFTIIIRSLLLPLTLPSLKAREGLMKLKPEIDKLKKKHQGNPQELQKAQIELYKKYNVNPLSGCLPQIIQLFVLITLYKSLTTFVQDTTLGMDPKFLWMNLTTPDPTKILPILAGVSQFIMSIMIAPGAEVNDLVPNQSKNKTVQEANKKEEDTAEMAAAMQQQMTFIMPVMTFFIALKFPSGLALYWISTTLFSIIQQYFISGLGGLKTYWQRIFRKK